MIFFFFPMVLFKELCYILFYFIILFNSTWFLSGHHVLERIEFYGYKGTY